MKKIIISLISVFFITSISNANYNLLTCKWKFFSNCPSFIIWKVLENTSVEKFENYNKISFKAWNNKVFLFSWWIENVDENIVNINEDYDKLNDLPKKNDILIYGNNLVDEKNNYLVNNYFQWFEKIYCENDKIKIQKNLDKNQLNISFDVTTKPKIKKWYNETDLEKDLQILAPCSKFNKLFWLEKQNFKNDEIKKNNSNFYKILVWFSIFLLIIIIFFILKKFLWKK